MKFEEIKDDHRYDRETGIICDVPGMFANRLKVAIAENGRPDVVNFGLAMMAFDTPKKNSSSQGVLLNITCLKHGTQTPTIDTNELVPVDDDTFIHDETIKREATRADISEYATKVLLSIGRTTADSFENGSKLAAHKDDLIVLCGEYDLLIQIQNPQE